jgi:hypothetical protein
MRNSRVIGTAAGLVTLGAVAAIGLGLRGGLPPRTNPKPHAAVGWVMARQTLELLKPGGQVMVITRDTDTFQNPATDMQLASFQKTLRKANVVPGSVRRLQVDPLRPVEVPAGDFLELVHGAPAGSVIVSFMGLPALSQAQRIRLSEIKPGVIAFCSGRLPDELDLKVLFKEGWLQAAVISRPNPPPASARPSSPQQWFDHLFVAVTAANVAELALGSDPAPRSP